MGTFMQTIGLEKPALADEMPTKAKTIIIACAGIGSVGGIIGGAKLWKKHPVWGALLGSLFVGGPLGSAVGHLIAATTMK